MNDNFANGLFKLSAMEFVHQLTKLQKSGKTTIEIMNDTKSIDNLIKDIALEYSLLTSQTSLFGKIKNKNKSIEELKKVEFVCNKIPDEYDAFKTPSKTKKRNVVNKYFPPSFDSAFMSQDTPNSRKSSALYQSRGRARACIKKKSAVR